MKGEVVVVKVSPGDTVEAGQVWIYPKVVVIKASISKSTLLSCIPEGFF